MKPTIQDILALPKAQQIAIVEAILAQWQEEKVDEILQQQIALAESIAQAIDRGEISTTALEAFKEKLENRRS